MEKMKTTQNKVSSPFQLGIKVPFNAGEDWEFDACLLALLNHWISLPGQELHPVGHVLWKIVD